MFRCPLCGVLTVQAVRKPRRGSNPPSIGCQGKVDKAPYLTNAVQLVKELRFDSPNLAQRQYDRKPDSLMPKMSLYS